MEDNISGDDIFWLQRFAIFDPAPLTEYESSAGRVGLEHTINECIEEARFRLDTVFAAVEAGDVETIQGETRVLKSMFESCGFPRLTELVRLIENAAAVRPAQDIKPLVAELSHILQISLAELTRFAGQFGARLKQINLQSR